MLEPRQDLQFIAGFSPSSPTLIGTAPDRQLALAGFSYGYRCWVLSSVSVSYTAALLPAAILIQPAETRYSLFPPSVRRIDSHAVYGFAVAPLGFTLEFARKRRLHPFAETLGGVIASSEPIPEHGLNATGLNFLFDFGGGSPVERWSRAGAEPRLPIPAHLKRRHHELQSRGGQQRDLRRVFILAVDATSPGRHGHPAAIRRPQLDIDERGRFPTDSKPAGYERLASHAAATADVCHRYDEEDSRNRPSIPNGSFSWQSQFVPSPGHMAKGAWRLPDRG